MHSTLISTLLVVVIAATAFADEDMLKNELDDAEMFSWIKDKCTRAGSSTYEKVQQAWDNMKPCLHTFIDQTQSQFLDEFGVAAMTMLVDPTIVSNRVCRRRQQAIDCITKFTTSIDECLEPEEKTHRRMFDNILTNLLNFVCRNDSEQIALFIAEKGLECFKEKADAIQDCANINFSQYMSSEGPSMPKPAFDEKECSDMDKLQVCIVRELKQCKQSTPANLVDGMLKIVRDETPCAKLTNKAANEQHISTFIVLGTLVMTLIARSLVNF